MTVNQKLSELVAELEDENIELRIRAVAKKNLTYEIQMPLLT